MGTHFSQIEALESRRLLSSPSYTVANLDAFFSRRHAPKLTAVGLSDSGVAVFTDGVSHYDLYLYSVRRHRLYLAGSDTLATSINSAGEIVKRDPAWVGDNGINAYTYSIVNADTGASQALNGFNDQGDPWPTSADPAGVVVGLTSTWHYPPPSVGLGGYATYQLTVYDPASGQTTTPDTSMDTAYDTTDGSAPLINSNGVIAYGDLLFASPSAQPVQLPVADGNISALSNTFAVGTTSNGVFLHDLSAGTQTVVALADGVESFTPTGVNDDGVVVGNMQIVRHRDGRRSVVTVAGEINGGTFYDLNNVSRLPAGIRLETAVSINASGQILAAVDSLNIAGDVLVLSPTGS